MTHDIVTAIVSGVALVVAVVWVIPAILRTLFA